MKTSNIPHLELSLFWKYIINMLTKDDIRKLIEVFATKTDIEELVTKLEFKITMDNVLNKLDAVYSEVKDVRQEQAFHAGRHEEITDDIVNLKLKLRN